MITIEGDQGACAKSLILSKMLTVGVWAPSWSDGGLEWFPLATDRLLPTCLRSGKVLMVLAWLGKGGPGFERLARGPLGGSERLLARAVTAE